MITTDINQCIAQLVNEAIRAATTEAVKKERERAADVIHPIHDYTDDEPGHDRPRQDIANAIAGEVA